ncbi:unnamed protein product [Malus baccata var. baccata]
MNRSKTVVFIWIFYTLLSTLSSKWLFETPTAHMGRDLAEHGLVFLKHGGPTSQYLSLSDIFTIRDGFVTPVLKAVNPHVHANVLKALKPILDPYFDEAIWFQNSSLYHFSMFHASHHISPIPATPDEIEPEAAAVRNIAKGLCPLKIVLDMVATSGSNPINIREKLRTALPRKVIKKKGKPKIMVRPVLQNYSATCRYYHQLGDQNSSFESFIYEAPTSKLHLQKLQLQSFIFKASPTKI